MGDILYDTPVSAALEEARKEVAYAIREVRDKCDNVERQPEGGLTASLNMEILERIDEQLEDLCALADAWRL